MRNDGVGCVPLLIQEGEGEAWVLVHLLTFTQLVKFGTNSIEFVAKRPYTV
jgi:hypothetical protein